ncbi:MAG TPA: hypothetical protein PLP34_00655 [Chitinophagaceae bacterium]|nr:hypothetical protein [Chitinophagaceae bacterium]HNF70890.1 hypothetical protein [Chitinophagaceae bacterium]
MAGDRAVFRSALLESRLSFSTNEIQIHTNTVACDFLKAERNRILDFFKNAYQNQEMNVLFMEDNTRSEQEGKKVLSTREMFDEMVQQNPVLKSLKDMLGMDFEY